jgi:hypothetical protein
MSKRERSGLLVRAVTVAVLSGFGFALIYWLGVLTGRGQRVENRALESSTYDQQWLGLLNLVSVPTLALALVVLIVLALVQRDLRNAIRAVLVIGIANVIAQALKYALLVRPDLASFDERNTFPSGHAVAFASVLFVAIMVVPSAARVAIAVLAAIVLGVVSFQLLGYGWHRLSDVAGGLLLVAGTVGVAHLLIPPRLSDRQWRPPLQFTGAAAVAAFLLMLAAGGLFVIAALTRDDREPAYLMLATQLVAMAVCSVCVWLVAVVAPHPQRLMVSGSRY